MATTSLVIPTGNSSTVTLPPLVPPAPPIGNDIRINKILLRHNSTAYFKDSIIEWEGKRYKITILTNTGDALAATDQGWEAIKTQQLRLLASRRSDTFNAQTVRSVDVRLQEGVLEFEKSTAPSGDTATLHSRSRTVSRESIPLSDSQGTTDLGSLRQTFTASPFILASSVPDALSRTEHLPRTPQQTSTSSQSLLPMPVRTLSGTRNQENIFHSASNRNDTRGRNSCTVNAGVALTRMLQNQMATGQQLDQSLTLGVNGYQALLPAYRQALPQGIQGENNNSPLLEWPFVHQNNPLCQQALTPVGQPNILARVQGQERENFTQLLGLLQAACPQIDQSAGAVITIGSGTYAIKATKRAQDAYSFDFYDSHGGGVNNAASLKTFNSTASFTAYLAHNFPAQQSFSQSDLENEFRRADSTLAQDQVQTRARESLDQIFTANNTGMYIHTLRPPVQTPPPPAP